MMNSPASGGKRPKTSGLFAEEMMILKLFDKDINVWRKRKDEVTKCFDDDQELEGMKNAMN